jgi:hypothetical protein
MKIQPMNGQLVTIYSDLTTAENDRVKLNSDCYISDSLKDEQKSLTGLVLEYPSTKSLEGSTASQRGVRFSNITIQEYSIEPGVNPGGTKGCPFTIGWEPMKSTSVEVDTFEESRYNKRRDWKHLKLTAEQREQILKGMGYSMKSIVAGTRAAYAGRRERVNTIARLKSSDTEQKIESLRKNVHNFVTFGKKKRREQKLLAPYQNVNSAFEATNANTLTV